MDLLGSLKSQTAVPGLGQDLPGLPIRLPGSKPAGDEPAASFDSFLPASQRAPVAADGITDLPAEDASVASPPIPVIRSSLSSMPRAPRKPAKARSDQAETGTDSSETASASRSTPTASAGATSAKSAGRAPQARYAATPATAVTAALSLPTPAPAPQPSPIAPIGNLPTSDSAESDPETDAPLAATSTVATTALPVASQPNAAAQAGIGAMPMAVLTPAPNESVPFSLPSTSAAYPVPVPDATSAANSGPVPVSTSRFASAPDESVPISPARSSSSGLTAQKQPVPVSSGRFSGSGFTAPNESVPLSAGGSPVTESSARGGAVSISNQDSTGYASSSGSNLDEPQSERVLTSVSSYEAGSPHRTQPAVASVPLSIPASTTLAAQSIPVLASQTSATVGGAVPVSTTQVATGTAFSVGPAAGSVGIASGASVSTRSRSWAVTAAYRNSARQPEEVASADSDETQPMIPPGTVEFNRVANIADPLAPAVPATENFKASADKNSLNTTGKQVTETSSRDGTSIAKSSAVPTNASSSSSSAASPTTAAAPRAAGRDGGVAGANRPLTAVSGSTATSFGAVSAGSSDRAAAAVTARDAIATVVKLAEAQQSRSDANAGSINLGFKFGDEHLGVRVELRSGQIHTQFITSSPELREALANQFVSLTGGTGSSNSGASGNSDRPYPFAQPEFTGAGSSTSDQRGSQQDTSQGAAEFALEGLAPARAADAAVESGTSASTPATPLSSPDLHLHAFA